MREPSGERSTERAERRPGGCLTRVLHIIHVSTCNFSLPAAAATVVVLVVATATATAVGGVGRHCYAGRVVKTPKTKAKPKSKREARGAFFLRLLTRSQKRGAERASLYATIRKRQLEREGRAATALCACVCVCAECHTPGHEIDYSVSRHSITLRRRQLELARCPAKRRGKGKATTTTTTRTEAATAAKDAPMHKRIALLQRADQHEVARSAGKCEHALNRDLSLLFKFQFIYTTFSVIKAERNIDVYQFEVSDVLKKKPK